MFKYFKTWLKPSRLIPLITILAAGVVIILSLVDVFELETQDEIIITLLALIAADALSERLAILEKINKQLSNLKVPQTLRSREYLPSLSEDAKNASEICVLAISAIALISKSMSFFEERIKSGATIRFVLLDLESLSIETLLLQAKIKTTKTDIDAALEMIKVLAKTAEVEDGDVQVRLTEVFLPFSMLAIDTRDESGFLVVEYREYKKNYQERPHIILKPHNKWYKFYLEQFEQAWQDGEKWSPNDV